MADWSLPTLTSTYANFLSYLQARDVDLALQFDGTTSTNLTTNTIRWDSTANRWKKWNGTSWAELTSTYALTGLSTTGAASIGTTLGVTGATTLATATATTPSTADNSTNVATTAYVKAQGYATVASPTFTGTVTIPTGASIAGYLTTASAASTYAPLASPTLTGTPAAPTATAGTNTTQIATTAFVATSYAPLASPTFSGTVTIPSGASISGYAPLASPTFTGTPAAPTATAGTSTTQVATTAFVNSNYAALTGATFTGTIYVANSSQPILTLNSTASGSWKSNIRFQNSGAAKYEIGVDTNAAGANNFYFYDAVAAVNRATIDASGYFAFDSGYGSVAKAYGCRAWVNFNGTTASPSTIRASGNVSSVTKNGTGDYTVNFTTAMADANYSVSAISASIVNSGGTISVAQNTATAPTSSAFRLNVQSSAGNQNDNAYVNLQFFR